RARRGSILSAEPQRVQRVWAPRVAAKIPSGLLGVSLQTPRNASILAGRRQRMGLNRRGIPRVRQGASHIHAVIGTGGIRNTDAAIRYEWDRLHCTRLVSL